MRRIIAFVLGAVIVLSSHGVDTIVEASEKPVLNIVALGDSYTAGNAAGDYYGPPECYRSQNNYSRRFADLHDREWTVNYLNGACSSAVAEDVRAQVESIEHAVASADIVFVSIGGNDGDFEAVARSCLLGPNQTGYGCVEKIEQSWLQLDGVVSEIESTLLYLKERTGSDAKIVLVGYPYLIGDCGLSLTYISPFTGLAANYDVSFELRNLQTVFNSKTKEMARSVGATFASLTGLYQGHEICGSKAQWIAGPTPSDIPESYHPNRDGHNATAQMLRNMEILPTIVPQPPEAPVYTTPPPATGTDGYPGLPFACGTVVPYASTYDQYLHVFHGHAIDLPMPAGTPIVAPVSGQAYVHHDPDGYGNFLDIFDSQGIQHRFAHLSSHAVSHDTSVSRGQIVGYVGSTGLSTGPHLHYEMTKGPTKLSINFGGAELRWTPRTDPTGTRTTTHALRSTNCNGSSWFPGQAETGRVVDPFADIFTYEYEDMRYGRSDGYDYSNWEVALPHIQLPYSAASCDFDNDGWDEYLSYERREGQHASFVMMADPDGTGEFTWSKIATVETRVDSIKCGDWNNDGRDDLLFHDSRGNFMYGRSNGVKVDKWGTILTGIGKPTFWEVCDINGDGQDDIVSYEKWGSQLMVGYRKTSHPSAAHWKKMLGGIYGLGAMACDNFQSHRGDELIVWDGGQNGRFVLGQFDRSFRRVNWDAISPKGIGKPYNGELVSGDIDGDGYAEFVSNEIRLSRGDHSVMVGDFTSANSRTFTWHPFIEGVRPRMVMVGRFIG